MTTLPPAWARRRRLLAAAFPALAALASLAWQIAGGSPPPPPPPPSDIAAFVERLAPVRAALERSGPVGYWADPGPKSARSVKEFMLTQYALAPNLVLEGTDPAWVVGNFHGAPPTAEEVRSRGLERVLDAGGGVLLYRRVR